MHDVGKMLQDLLENFHKKVATDLSLIVQIDVQPSGQSWCVIIEPGQRISLTKGAQNNAEFVLTTTEETLRLIYEGKMTALTAGGKAKGSDRTLLEIKPGKDVEFTPETRVKMFSFLQHFFNRTTPERINLGEQHSRMIHGGHAIPLYYYHGFRSAWYMLKKGERLNEAGDTNPFPQAFIFISGEGFATIGDETVQVSAGESYYIPPGSDHIVWTESEDPLVLIWLAWGEGA